MKAKFFGVMLLSAAITFIGCEPVTPDPGQPDQPGGGKDTTEQPVDDGIESIVIDENTNIRDFKRDLMLGDIVYR